MCAQLAIQSDARHLIAAPLTQRILTAVYNGDLTYDSVGGHSILADNYKVRLAKPLLWR